jgi:sulfite exporter TauE/SafE
MKKDLIIATLIATLFAGLFIALQKLGLADLISAGSVTYGTAFIVGIVASLSTCTASVGGLLLSMSATFAKEGDRVRPQLLFHGGRLASFFVLGGIIGSLGAVFTLSPIVTFVLTLVIGVVMLLLGINLLDIFSWADKFKPSLPDFMARRVHGTLGLNHTLTPLLVGIATFFLPCGFTQSMQIYTLSTGGFFAGALTMLVFALGTLPVLALMSFSSLSIKDGPKASLFFKTAGIIVIMFASFNILSAFDAVGLGFGSRISSEGGAGDSRFVGSAGNVSIVDGVQIVEIRARGGYSPRKSIAQAGIPTVIRFNTAGTFDCSSSIRIPSLNVSKILPQSGATDIQIGAQATSTLEGSCGMGMYPFEIDFK